MTIKNVFQFLAITPCIFLIIFMKPSFLESNRNSPEHYQLKFLDAELIRNDHVGNEWLYYAEIGDTKIFKGEKVNIYLNKDETIILKSVISETEEKYNDFKIEKSKLDQRILNKYLDSGFYIEVIIKEYNGRYAGNTATWRFYYEVMR